MTEATEPLMTRVEDIPKKLDAILEQLTILSGVAASASRTEKAEARKISSKKVNSNKGFVFQVHLFIYY